MITSLCFNVTYSSIRPGGHHSSREKKKHFLVGPTMRAASHQCVIVVVPLRRQLADSRQKINQHFWPEVYYEYNYNRSFFFSVSITVKIQSYLKKMIKNDLESQKAMPNKAHAAPKVHYHAVERVLGDAVGQCDP